MAQVTSCRLVEMVLSGRNIKNHADLRQWKKEDTLVYVMIVEAL